MQSQTAGTACVVGLGRMGLRHLEVLRELSFRIVGVCDRQEAARAAAASQFSVESSALFVTAEEMLAKVVPDLLVVATTADSHCAVVCLAADAGVRKILCEKPMATSLRDCDMMIDRCASRGGILAVNHQMRYTEQCLLPASLLRSDDIGGLTSMLVKAGNFGLANNGSHYIEMFGFIAGERPAVVTGWLSPGKVPNPRGVQFEDSGGSIRIETASGKRFYMDAGSDQGHGIATTYLGRFGRIEVDELAGELHMVCRGAEDRELPTTRYGMPAVEQRRTIEPTSAMGPTKSLLEAMLRGEAIPDGSVGRAAVEVLVAAHVSHDQGNRPIELRPDALPRDRQFKWA